MVVSDEEKRWLVVGIAMNKVAAPVLRDFIKKRMDSHYANNTYCHGLTTPCALNTLTYHQVNADPNLKRLKFQNINNNRNNHGNHKNLYNYNINSSVDLAKLFLPDYLAEFSGFDDSLDMSAILWLLGCNNPAPIFLSPNPVMSIHSAADDVRENVRNKWGHCNVTDWTEVLFNDCFSMLETLVRSLGLTGGLEKTTLDQLSDWRTKGCQLCMGHAVDKKLLSLVQKEVKGIIADLAGHNARLNAVETKLEKDEEARREEIDKILERLVSMEKLLSEELLRRVEGVELRVEGVEQRVGGVEQGVEGVEQRVEGVEQRVGGVEQRVEGVEQRFEGVEQRVEGVEQRVEGVEHRVEGVEQGLAETNIKVEVQGKRVEEGMAQLQDSLTKTVEQLVHEIKSKGMENVKPAAAPAETFDVKICRSKLAERYKRTATVPTSVWSKTSPVDINQIYTRLSWVKEEQTPAVSSRSKLNHYTDVFTANKNGVVPKRILVQGQTGIGKSTFVKKLAVDWAELDDATTGDKQKDILKKFELLVVVNLKEVSKCQSLKDVISCSSIFARKDKHLTDSLLNYINNNEDKVLLVFDGYDEYRCGIKSEIYEIFRENELRNCCVLITTRISKADELRPFKDIHAEITGFSEEDRKAFMSRMLGGEAEARELSRHLNRQNLKDLAKVPLLLLFFCTLWKKGKSKSFSESKTKLYLAIVQYVLDYNQGKDCPAHFGKVHDFEDVLAEIGKVALECLLKDDHVFEYDQLSAAVLCDESRIIGLLQVTEYAENPGPTGMVSFIHKSIQEFLAAWFVTYRCVPEGNLGGIEQHASTFDDCEALENVFQFVCGLSDNGAVKVFQLLTSVRISDPTLVDLSKIIPDVENETDVPMCDVTETHVRFSDLVYQSFLEVQSKDALVRHWLDSTAGIILITYLWQLPQHIPTMTLSNEAASYKAVVFCGEGREHMSRIYDVLKFLNCLHVPLRITENSAAVLTGDFLTQFKTVGCEDCCFNCILRFHNGKAQFHITRLELRCDDHASLFTETISISTPSCSTNLCSKQSCLKFLSYLGYFEIATIEQPFKDLGAVLSYCKHLKTIQLKQCGDAMCELLNHMPNSSTCSLKIDCVGVLRFLSALDPEYYLLTSVGAEKLANVLPRFNVTALRLDLDNCCAAALNKLLCSITHKTLRELSLRFVSLTPAVAAALGQLLPEMSSLQELELTGVDGSSLQAEEMEALFGGINETFSDLKLLDLEDFNARGSLAALTKRVHFFPNWTSLSLRSLNMDERDLGGLLESLRSIRNPLRLILYGNPLGSPDLVQSMVQEVPPQVNLYYEQY